MRRIFILVSASIICASLGVAVAQSNPPAQKPATPDPETQRQSDEAMHTRPGQAGTQEPKPVTPKADQANDPVLVNGVLNVPGADPNGQTVPAKFSKRNDAIDKLPIMAYPLALNDEQKRIIRDSIRDANRPVVKIEARITEELPNSVPVYELPEAVHAAVPGVRGLKYVPLQDKILLVDTPNMIVVGEIGL